MKHQEHIVALPAHIIPTQDDSVWTRCAFDHSDVVIKHRASLEQDPNFRQTIPYAALRCGEKFALYRRTQKGNEAGLHDKYSIGFGGHMDIADVVYDENSIIDIHASIALAAQRELEEEVALTNGNKAIKTTAYPEMIASNANEVDAVHLGIFTIIDVENESIESNEDQLEIVGFKTLEELAQVENLESWSQIIVDRLSQAD